MLVSLLAVNPPEHKLKNGPVFPGEHKRSRAEMTVIRLELSCFLFFRPQLHLCELGQRQIEDSAEDLQEGGTLTSCLTCWDVSRGWGL